MEMLEEFGIATIPVSGFFTKEPQLKDWLRFAACKSLETIDIFARVLKK